MRLSRMVAPTGVVSTQETTTGTKPGAPRAPAVGGWLRSYARALATGPDLSAKLYAYYAHDKEPHEHRHRAPHVGLSTAPRVGRHQHRLSSTAGVPLLRATVVRTLAVDYYAD